MQYVLALATLALAACHADDATVDAAAGDAAADAGSIAAPPEIPWLEEGLPPIALTPCPTGWREVMEDGVTTCDPYPEDGPAACARGEAHFAGEAACRPIGDPCPAGDYATTLPADGSIVYVRASAGPAGSGTLAAPYATLSEVSWLSLAPGTTVALARGTYEGVLPLRAGVHVVGACVAETIVTGVMAPVPSVIAVTSAGEPAEVRNVAILDAPQGGVILELGRALSLEGVLIERATGFSIVADDAATILSAHGLVIRDTRPIPLAPGRAIEVGGGARVHASRVLLERNYAHGVAGLGPGTEIVLEDAIVRETQVAPDGSGGMGLFVQDGARLEASRALVAQSHYSGVVGYLAGTEVVLADTVVQDTQSRGRDGTGGVGILLGLGARLEASRLRVTRNQSSGVLARSAGTDVTVADTVVRETQGQARDGAFGVGVSIEDGAHFTASRLLVAQNYEVGLFAGGAGTLVLLSDATLRETRSRTSDGTFGRGIHATNGARLDVSRALVAENQEGGVFGHGPDTDVTLTDVAVRHTRGRDADGAYGYGLSAQLRASFNGERVQIMGTRELGLLALGDATVELRDVSVTDVEPSECDCGRALGYGVAAMSGTVRLTRFEVRNAATCGLFVADIMEEGFGAPSLDVESGIVAQAEIGACIQVDGYDLARLTSAVYYSNNGTNLESTTLPLPDPLAPDGR